MNLLSYLFGCAHNRTTFPLTRERKKGPYVVCLDCGKEFGYDWENMCVAKQKKTEKPGQLFALQGEE